ncbi:MAG: transcriptional regulator [Proteobacteria bacterium]|nr:transcriptional regulator [Pseudomonadota bacterium]MCP4922071.1 transcriptional regulator [Pseudomonadota bacterium]
MTRSYSQFCGLARALDVVGERWTLLLVRDLLLGPKRYSDLLAGLPGLTTNLLAKRLKHLVAEGLVEKRTLDHGVTAYALTTAGLELEPVVMALGRFGGRYMDGPRESDVVDIAWGLVSMKRRYVTGTGHVGIELPDRAFHIRFSPEHVDVKLGRVETPATAHTSVPTLRRLFWMGAGSGELIAAGDLRVEGDPAAWDAFIDGFGLT